VAAEPGLDLTGQLVSLGDLTLQLTNAFTSRTAVAAGRTLTINSGGDIDNRSVLQGQAVNLNAGGQLSNNGQITTGGGTSTLSGSSVALNAAGSVQGGATSPWPAGATLPSTASPARAAR
jgi:filamentous hemagglutinin